MPDAEEIRRVLPRGRNALAREVVANSQRTRLIESMRELAARNGYANVTIAQLVARAGVGKPTFYEYFENKEDCFLAVFDEAVGDLITAINASLDPEGDLEPRIRSGIRAILGFVAEDDDRARIMLFESSHAGQKVMDHYDEVRAAMAQFYISLRAEVLDHGADLKPLSTTRASAIVGATIEPVSLAVRRGDAGGVLALEDELVEVVTLLAAP